MQDVGLRMFNIAVLESPARRNVTSDGTKLRLLPATKSKNMDISKAMSECTCKEELLNVFLRYRTRLQDLKLEAALNVTMKQIRKDLTREIVEINGSKFSDHTKDSGELDMLEAVLKRSLIVELIKAQESVPCSSKSNVLPPSAPPQPPSRTSNRRLSTNFMDVLDKKLGQILMALSRTNSGADSYNKVVELFGLGGRFLVKPAALRNRPTKVMFSSENCKCLVQCYNNYEIVFLDKNYSPLTGKNNIIMVETRLVEVIDLSLDVSNEGFASKKQKSKRVLSITIPSVELELQERQLEAEVRRTNSNEDIPSTNTSISSSNVSSISSSRSTVEISKPRSNAMRQRRLRNRVAWSRGRELGRGSAGATLQQRRMAELRFKIAKRKKDMNEKVESKDTVMKSSSEDLVVD